MVRGPGLGPAQEQELAQALVLGPGQELAQELALVLGPEQEQELAQALVLVLGPGLALLIHLRPRRRKRQAQSRTGQAE